MTPATEHEFASVAGEFYLCLFVFISGVLGTAKPSGKPERGHRLLILILWLAHLRRDQFMPRKLPRAYHSKLKEEQVRQATSKAKREERQKKQDDQGLSKVGMLRSFEGDCTACGQRTRFTVDALGYCKCGRCGSQANFRLGVP